MKLRTLPIVLLTAVLMIGCAGLRTSVNKQPAQETARDAVATAKGYLDSAKAKHPECPASVDLTTCKFLARATAAKDTVIDAVNAYCGSVEYDSMGGPCAANSSLEAKLSSAMSDLRQSIADVKGIGGK